MVSDRVEPVTFVVAAGNWLPTRVALPTGAVGSLPTRGTLPTGTVDSLPAIYMPFSQFPPAGLRTIHGWFSPAWIVREAKAGAVTDLALRRAMEEIDPQLAVTSIRGIDEVQGAALARQRTLMCWWRRLAASPCSLPRSVFTR